MSEEQEKKFFELVCICDMQQKEIKKLQNKIDKTIKYIGETNFIEKGYINFCYELEKILKEGK